NPQNGADYILITHSDLAAQARRLADYRASQGLRVAVVDVQDVFDEFSGGIFDPRAIRSFLKYAFENWRRPAPAYVLLLGDATLWMNKKIAWNHPQSTLIPSMMVYTFSFGMTSSDNYFAAVSGDDELPDLFIGRLPANSPEEAAAMIDKIIAYETKQTAEEWRRHITVAAGTGDFFGYAADYVTQYHLPKWLIVHRLDADFTSPNFHTAEDLIGWINSGQNILNFLVHGAGEQIDDAKLLEKDDLLRLNNRDKYPFCSTMSCYIGHFDDPAHQSLGEALLTAPEKGIMALFGSAGKSYRYADFYFNNAVFEGIFRQRRRTLGEITTLAKYDLMAQTRGFDEPVRNFILFGDPALSLRLPEEKLVLTSAKSVLSEGDAMRVTGSAPSRGTLMLSAVSGRSTIAEQSFEVNGTFTVDLFRLTPQIRSLWGTGGGVGYVKAFFSDGSVSQAGALSFGVLRPLLRRFGTQPETPVGGQPFAFVAEIDGRVAAESGGIRSLTAQWKIGESWKDAPMSLAGDGLWKSGEFSWEEGTVVAYRLQMVTGIGEIVTDPIQLTIRYKPDLYTDTPLRRISGDRPELLAKIKNRGDSDARIVPITIRDVRNGAVWTDRFVVPWVRSRADTLVRIPVPNVSAGSYELELLIDPENKVAEEEENNNRFVQTLCLVTPENGSAGAFRFLQDQVALILPPNSVERPSSLELNALSDSGLQRTAENASLLPLKRPGANAPAIYRFIFADTTLKPLKPVKASIAYDAQDSVLVVYGLQSVRVYVWESVFGLWRAVPTQHLPEQGRFVADLPPGACVFALMANRDKTPPTIRIDVLGQNFADGDITPQRPQFVVSLSDESGVDVTPERLQISLDGRLLSPAEYALNFDAKEPRFAHLSFKTDFDGGEHEILVSAGDFNANRASRTVRFRIAEEFGVRFVANHPNPFLDETVIAFYIDDVANKVKLDIYTVSGRHIRGFEMVDVSGYQEVVWDGMDKEGEPIANGVYYLKFTAVRDDRRIERIEKMAKLE
ncbi:MAG: C25 family cysteine peptidase, partial [candidate division KSB1 bacterium]|nr:C25 family cysteine peptidase [candidate division KSB1 bacterium]